MVVNIELMIRKITLICLLLMGLNSAVKASVVLDSVSIYLPLGMDTTCPGTQLNFYAIQSNDTFSTSQYHWYINSAYTGVSIDSFHTTAAIDGDTVYCEIVYKNSLGVLDSYKSNMIIIHRSTSFPPRVMISLTVGSNPDCMGGALTFTAYPVNGGSAPTFQWLVNGLILPAEDSQTITKYFTNGDTVSCQMISNSTCSAPYNDTDTSNYVVISHDSITALITITAKYNPICAGTLDSFNATISNQGVGASLSWYVDSLLIPTVLGPWYGTNTLHDHDLVYCVLNAPDPCVINHTTYSNYITMTVLPLQPTSAWTVMTYGANPGCLDSPVTFTGHFLNFGTFPNYDWYVNGILIQHNDSVFTDLYLNGDVVSYKVTETDNGCYTNDSVTAPTTLMVRDSTPVTPLLSLIGDLLVVNGGGRYQWHSNTVLSYTGSVILSNTLPTFNPGVLGYYYVVKDTLNCPSLPSNIIYISLLDVKNVSMPEVKLYPNPTSGMVNLDWGGQVVNMKMDVYDIVGHGLLHQDIVNESHHQADLSYLPEGNYLMVLRSEDGSKATYKIFLNK